MEIPFWIAIGILAYSYAGYPLLLWLWGLIRRKTPRWTERCPKVTLLIPAYNEEKVIAQKIENTLALDYPQKLLEIVVASESTDGTNGIVVRYARQGVKLRAFDHRRGKVSMLYATVPQAEGEIVIFSDANALYEPEAIRKLVRNFGDPRIGCVSGRLEYVGYDAGSAGASESLYWRYEMWLKSLESRLFSLLGANGSIFALRKELYRPLSENRGDDFELPVRVLLQGYGAILEPAAISREKASESTAGQFRRRVRIVAWLFVSASMLCWEAARRGSPFVLFQLISHKLLRWFGPVCLGLILASSAFLNGIFYRAVLCLQLAFYALALTGWAMDMRGSEVPRLLRLPYYFCTVNLAALIGMAKVLVSRPAPVWERVR